MKWETTKKGPINGQAELKMAWIQCWQDMPQEKIQAWVERILIHIKEVIRCEGNNLYKEGRKAGQESLEYTELEVNLLGACVGCNRGHE